VKPFQQAPDKVVRKTSNAKTAASGFIAVWKTPRLAGVLLIFHPPSVVKQAPRAFVDSVWRT
jgi:hypothetical protein